MYLSAGVNISHICKPSQSATKLVDQSNLSEQEFVVHLAEIETNQSLSFEDLDRIVNSSMQTTVFRCVGTVLTAIVHDPSVQIIDATSATGQNTKILISLCEKMVTLAKTGYDLAISDLEAATQAISNLNTVSNDLIKSGAVNTEYTRVIRQLANAEEARLNLVSTLGAQMKELEAAVGTMIKLGNGLLADQEKHGSEIKTGAALVRYMFTCRAINGQWKDFKAVFERLRDLRERVQKLYKMRSEEGVVFKDASGNTYATTELTFDELTKAVAELVALGSNE